MKALVLSGKVVQMSAVPFPVHASLEWIEVDDLAGIAPGWSYAGGVFIPPVVTAVTPDFRPAAERALMTKFLNTEAALPNALPEVKAWKGSLI